jgi:hypothetical protein
MKTHNLAMGLGVAVLGFAVWKYFQQAQQSAGQAALASPNAGALWQNLTIPLGTATGGVNSMLNMDQIYSSTAWNPDSLSTLVSADSGNAMQRVYGVPLINQFGFTMPSGS